MGIFNHLFGGRKGLARELVSDSEKLIELWKTHLRLYRRKKILAKRFSFKHIEDLLKNPERLEKALKRIEKVVMNEIINIEGEEKLEEEIITDLKKLNSEETYQEIMDWTIEIGKEKNIQTNILNIFGRLHQVLSTELHIIRIVKKRILEKNYQNIKDLLLGLFQLIFHREDYLYDAFDSEAFRNKNVPLQVEKIVRAILLEEKLEKEELIVEDKFLRLMVKVMGKEKSSTNYRKLGKNIYSDIMKEAGAPFMGEDAVNKGLEKFVKMAGDDNFLQALIKKHRPDFDDKKTKRVMEAFRKAEILGHFDMIHL